MNTDIQLPSVFPQEEIRVDQESHRYETFEDNSGSVTETREYTLNKAPATVVESVSGIFDGQQKEFVSGTDYVLSADKERIVWLNDPADRPDAGTTFFVTYRCESIISRYIGSVEAELDTSSQNIDEIVNSKFVNQAQGVELDQLGSLFGVLGERNGRGDEKYRGYLKAIVQSFSSRGKRSDIKDAIAASLSGPTEETRITSDDVIIVEDFETTSYTIVLTDWTNHRISTLYEIAEIVDPSGVHQNDLQYKIPEQESQTADEVVSTDGYQVVDESQSAVDFVLVNITVQETTDTSESTDSITDDVTLSVGGSFRFDKQSWDSFEWEGTLPGEELQIDDIIQSNIDTNSGIYESSSKDVIEQEIIQSINNSGNSTDSVNSAITDGEIDDSSSTDLIKSDIDDNSVESTASLDDTATARATTIIWDGGSYDEMNWD